MLRFGVIGYPVAHSLSPQIHKAAFQALGIEADFERLEVLPEKLEKFMNGFRKIYAGCNVTIPHKEKVIGFLDEIDGEAQAIGAVNTIVNRNGKLIGYNTDIYGAMEAFFEGCYPESRHIFFKGKRVTVLGAGGASRAVSFGVLKFGGNLRILNRRKDKAFEIAKDFAGFFPGRRIETGSLEEFDFNDADVVINTTPCGMHPKSNESSIMIKGHGDGKIVMDIVYYPRQTKLIRDAANLGCKIITGERMFLLQGARAFEIWTGKKAPLETMEKVLYQALEDRDKA